MGRKRGECREACCRRLVEPGRKTCSHHLAQVRLRKVRMEARRAEEGRCARCGGDLAEVEREHGYLQCGDCRRATDAKWRKWAKSGPRERRKARESYREAIEATQEALHGALQQATVRLNCGPRGKVNPNPATEN